LALKVDTASMRNQPSKFVRPGALPANTDVKTYDVGNFYISTYGNVNTTVIGELHVRYRVRFSKPVLEAAGSANASGAFALFGTVTAGEASSGGAYQIKFADSIFNPIQAVNTAGSIVLPAGAYLIESAVVDTTSGGLNLNLEIAGVSVAQGNATGGAKGCSTTSWLTSSAAAITLTLVATGSTGADVLHGWVRITYLQPAVLALPFEESASSSEQYDELRDMRTQLKELQDFMLRNRALRRESSGEDEFFLDEHKEANVSSIKAAAVVVRRK